MDAVTLWEGALPYIKENISTSVGYNLYIKDAVPVSFDGKTITISVEMKISKNMIECRYKKILEAALTGYAGYPVSFYIIVSDNKREEITDNKIKREESVLSSSPYLKPRKYINPKYTFDTFVIGTSNEYATTAALKVSQNPGKTNPLFFYGNSGLGKTHLMCAIGNYMLEQNPDMNVVYVSSEKFMNDFISCLRDKNNNSNIMNAFRDMYRKADALLIDDIQFLAHGEQTQDEFFHTFNELYDANKQIVITSDRKPSDLKTFVERLRARFAQGLIVDISAPNYETRVAILQKKSQLMGVYISEEVIDYIANRIKSNVRELEGALTKVITDSQIRNCPITTELADNAIKTILPDDGIIKITPDKIIEKVCIYYNITKENLLGKTKTKNFTIPRQVAMYLCKTLTTYNFVELERYFEKDRTTIMYSVNKMEDNMLENDVLRSDINYIKQDLNSL